MKHTLKAHHLFASLFTISLLTTPVMAEQDDAVQAPPSAEEINNEQDELVLKTHTVYETSFLPGVRLCEQDEIDYRGDFRKVNCQDEELIQAVSTRKDDPYNTRPNIIINDRIEPNGNIFRINFRRKATIVENTSEN